MLEKWVQGVLGAQVLESWVLVTGVLGPGVLGPGCWDLGAVCWALAGLAVGSGWESRAHAGGCFTSASP